MASAIAPRPIAWVSSRSKDGIVNLAPFSFFQMVTATPPTLMISPLRQSDGSLKDTTRNIIETGEFVVNLVPHELREKMNATSFSFPGDVSEIEQCGIATQAAERVKPPRVIGVPVSFECRLASAQPYPADKPSCHIILGEVLIAHIDDRVLDEHGHIDPRKLDLISRMGGDWYGRINSDDNFKMTRPQGWDKPAGKQAVVSSAATPAATEQYAAEMQQALAHHQAERLPQAEALYRQILAMQPRHADALHYLGMLAHQGGNQQESTALIEQAIEIDAGNPLYHYNLGTIYRQRGDLASSITSYRKAIAHKSDYADAHYRLAISLQQARQYAEAEQSYRQVIAIAADNAAAHNNLGVVLQQMARFAEAEASYQQALRIKPDFADAHLNLGNLLKDSGQLQAAERHYRKALDLQPAYAQAHSNLGVVLGAQGHVEEAERSYRHALALQPNSSEMLGNLGFLMNEQQRFTEAEDCFRQMLRLQPESAECHYNLAVALSMQGKTDEAEILFVEATRISPEFAASYNYLGNLFKDQWRFDESRAAYMKALSADPQFEAPYNNLGAMLRALGEPFESEKWLRRALLIEPDSTFLLHNLCLALFDQGRHAESRAICLRLLELAPDDAHAHLKYALLLLENAEFKQGWREFEYRLQVDTHFHEVDMLAPHWDGRADIAGKTILLHAEKGYGDSLQMCRYATLVAARGAKVVLAVPEALRSLLARCSGVSACYSDLPDLPKQIDHQISLMSLPFAFDTELQTIPAEIPYLHSDPELVQRWREKIGQQQGLRVGLVWAGNPRKHIQQAHLLDRQRSIPFEKMMPLLEVSGIEFFSLQLGEEAQAQMGEHPEVRDFTTAINDFDDTAALIDNLDLVISVDTSVAHLAGALGKPVWMLNRFNSCWRWLLNRQDSPWYPTMRIFRQPSFGDWDSVISEVSQVLREWVARSHRPTETLAADPAIAPVIQQALAHHQAGRLPQAEALYQQILASQPRHADALHYLGMLMHQRGRRQEAIDLIRQAIASDASNALYPYNLGTLYRQSGDLNAAISCYKQAIASKENFVDAYFKLAVCHQAAKQLVDAETVFRQTVALSPEHVGAHFNLGNVLQEMGRIVEAEASYRQALRLKPDFADVYLNFGNLLKDSGNLRDAEMNYRMALELQPNYVLAHSNLGVTLSQLERFDEAEQCYRQALALQPDSFEIHSNLGYAMMEQHRFVEAEQYFRSALRLQPGFAEAHNNLGIVLNEQDKLEEAESAFRKALDLQPSLVVGYNNLGNLLREMGRLDEAEACHISALRINPDYYDVHLNYSFVLLQRGDFLRGWEEYEYRWKSRGFKPTQAFAQPMWDGITDLRGKAILLHAEQGLGDTLQFIRYASLLRHRGATVYALVPPVLKSLVATCDGVARAITPEEALPSFDWHCPLLSLPRLLRTDLASIPSKVPYLTPSQMRVERWRKQLGKKSAIRVGLVWAGSPRKELPAAHLIDRRRSMHFDTIKPLLSAPGVQFVSLQLGEKARAQIDPKVPLLDVADELRDFEETAALISNLDLVISVDTSVAHLAGALGKPTWMLNRFNTCWRWFSGRTDSPWYPSMRIFRQPSKGDWNSVIAAVQAALAQLVAESDIKATPGQAVRKKKR